MNIKEVVLSKMNMRHNINEVQSKNYTKGDYLEAFLHDISSKEWYKDSNKYSKANDILEYGSVKSDKCTVIQGKKGDTKKDLINEFDKNVYSEKFSYCKVVDDDILVIIFNKKQFIRILKLYGRLDRTSSKRGSKSKIRLTLSNTRINQIRYELYPDITVEKY